MPIPLTAALRFGTSLLLPVAIADRMPVRLDRQGQALDRVVISTELVAALVAFGMLGDAVASTATTTELVVVAGCVAINIVEGNLAGPELMGRHPPPIPWQ